MGQLPPQAKRVFSGVVYNVYHWQQTLFDGSQATFEMIERPDNLSVIPVYNGKILMAHEQQPCHGSWISVLGGRREPNEEPLAGAQRELKEETGLVSDDWELLIQFDPIPSLKFRLYLFVARHCRKVAEPQLDAGEKIKLEAVDFGRFLEIVGSPEYLGPETALHIMRMQLYDKPALEAFRRKIFQA